ncbi:hypothetical protein HDC93_000765 [Streptomyces sp. AK010]|nr:hypothetical protein [Streptomyces sp. AK010]
MRRASNGKGVPLPGSLVDRRKTGSKHHLICDGKGTPLLRYVLERTFALLH